MGDYLDEVKADNPLYLFTMQDGWSNTGIESSYSATPSGSGVAIDSNMKIKGLPSTYFNGTAGLNISPNAPEFNGSKSDPFTIEMWVKSDSPTVSRPVVFRRTGTQTAQVACLSTGNADLYTGSQNVKGGNFITGNWHYVVAVYSGSYARLYIDGVATAGGAGPTSMVLKGSTFCLGGYTSSSYWKGWIAAPAIYQTVLDDTALERHMNASDVITRPPFTGWGMPI